MACTLQQDDGRCRRRWRRDEREEDTFVRVCHPEVHVRQQQRGRAEEDHVCRVACTHDAGGAIGQGYARDCAEHCLKKLTAAEYVDAAAV